MALWKKGAQRVDKLKNGKTITIKINGKNQPFVDDNKGTEQHPNYKFPESAVQKEEDSSQGYHETAASQEASEESFDWILPQQNSKTMEVDSYKVMKNTTYSQKKNPSKTSKVGGKKNNGALKKIMLTAVFAVLIGTSFGVLMLKLVVSDRSNSTTTQNAVAVNEATTASGTSSKLAVPLQSFSTYIVQEGVYSSPDAAKEVAKQAVNKGIPATTITMNGQNYLFIGLADTIETAKALGSLYRNKGVGEPYAKLVTLPAKKVKVSSTEEKQFLQNTGNDFQLLSKATASAILSSSTTGETQKASEINLTNEKQISTLKLKKMAAALTGAKDQLLSYEKSKDIQELYRAEQYLLTFLNIYYSL